MDNSFCAKLGSSASRSTTSYYIVPQYVVCPVMYLLCWVCACMRVVGVTKATDVQTHSLRWSVYRFCKCFFTSIMFLFIYFITSLELRRKSFILKNIHVLPYIVYDSLAIWSESFLNDLTFFQKLNYKAENNLISCIV